jgi:protocatechuate 3,4-dioxygenase, alpha subunit
LPPRTPSQTVGPFFAFSLCDRPAHELVQPSEPGAVRLTGRVLDGAGVPVDDALVEIWHPEAGFGRASTDADGRFAFVFVKPPGAGEDAPHLNVMLFARGLLKQVATRIYFPDEEAANGLDPLLTSLTERDRATLVAEPDGEGGLRFDVHLQGERETVFFAL